MIFSSPKAFTTRLLSALAFAAASVAGASGIAEAATCITCHAPTGSTTDIRPVDSVFRNITTGGFKASHAKHIPAPTVDANTCAPCHGPAVLTYVTKHRDGFINITSSTAPGLSYSKGSKFPQSGAANLTLGTCSTASCHADPYGAGTVTTPVWGTAAASCTACHTIPIGANGPATGSHTTTAGHAVACTSCHAAGTSATSMPSTSHNDGNITIVNVGYPAIVAKHAAGSGYNSCSTASCHADPYSAGTVTTPVWGTSAGCAACHTGVGSFTGTGTAPATGTHNSHMALTGVACGQCHTGAVAGVSGGTNHVNGTINVTGGYPVTAKHAPGTYTGTCSTTLCHGSSSPVWGANTNNNTCTKCHGTGTVTVTAANLNVVAPSDPAATGTGKVSANVKTGAHQTHLLMLNGLSPVGTIDQRCQNCHGPLPTTGTHATGSSTPVFQGLATNNGAMTASYAGTNCSNTYCHNPAGTGGTLNPANAGTGITPSWTNAAYIAGGVLKTQANCGVCHKSPGDAGFTAAIDHGPTAMPLGINTDCSVCHGHNGDLTGIAGQQHIDGIKYGGGNCDSCHDYDTVGATYAAGSWTGGTWGKNSKDGLTPNEGFGAHSKHINYIKSRLGIAVALTAANQTYGTGQPASVCGTCHSNLSANHTISGSTVRTINFGDGAFTMGGTSLLFGATNPVYNGVSGTSSATTPKTCSNLSCHYFTTPLWSSY